MDILRDLNLVRAVEEPHACAFRAASDDDAERDGILGTLEVRFSPFRRFYPISSFFEGDFMERTWPGAFRKTIAENLANIRVQFDHGQHPSIGSMTLGGIESLREESDSPVGIVALDDTSFNRDLLPGLKRGGYGASFRFQVLRDEWADDPGPSEHNPKGLPERTIKEVRLMEFGPVVWGANPAATAGVRSATDDYYNRLRAQEPQQHEELLSRAVALRQPGAALRTPGPDGAAQEEPPAPAEGHPGGYSARERRALIYPILKEQIQ